MFVTFVTNVGSKLYGTNTLKSDTDFKGFCFEDVDQVIGLRKFEQQQYNNNVEDGPNKCEGSIFSIKNYMNLCFTGNPTVIEIAFANQEHWMHITPVGAIITKYVRDNFLTKHLFKPYSAYHRSQIRKLQSMKRTGKRASEIAEHGYDIKFAMHGYRLARQCCIVMEEGSLRPTLDPEDKEMCMNFRNAKYTKEEALEILEDVDKKMYEAYKISTLPEAPDFNAANAFVTNLYMNYLHGSFQDQYKEFKPW